MSLENPGVSAGAVRSISTPDKVESRLGTLELDDGAPSDATAAVLYDNLDCKGWWTILRLYNPEQAFFDKTWRPSEIEPI